MHTFASNHTCTTQRATHTVLVQNALCLRHTANRNQLSLAHAHTHTHTIADTHLRYQQLTNNLTCTTHTDRAVWRKKNTLHRKLQNCEADVSSVRSYASCRISVQIICLTLPTRTVRTYHIFVWLFLSFSAFSISLCRLRQQNSVTRKQI